ncbi:hypothetical protein [Microbispora bryophytorum]|uniref:hypothetical protein n=1 Tax=Microbispora bryophytorum TaxID=1460882 RepID=UPI0033DD9FCF
MEVAWKAFPAGTRRSRRRIMYGSIVLGDEEDPFTYMKHSLIAHPSRAPGRDISAEQFHQFARESLGTTERALIDSFGHSKRAIHALIDDLLHAYGLFVRNKQLNFPKKLQLLHEIGTLALSILRNLNVERNAMEHEYRVPDSARVQEAIEVLDLLIPASRDRSDKIPYECVVGLKETGSHGILRLDPIEGSLGIHPVKPPSKALKTQHDVETIWTPVRHPRNGGISPEFKMDADPLWKYPLKFDNRDVWTPWIRGITTLQYGGRKAKSPGKSIATILAPFSIEVEASDMADMVPLFTMLKAAKYDTYENIEDLPSLDAKAFSVHITPDDARRLGLS